MFRTIKYQSVQFSSVPWPIGSWGVGAGGADMRDDLAEILFKSFLQEALLSSSLSDKDVQSLMLSIQHSLCWPQRYPPFKVPLGMVLERLLWHDMPKTCKFPFLDSCQKRFLWTPKKLDLAPYRFIGLVFHIGSVEKFPQALGFESLDPFFSQRAGSMFHSHRGGCRWQETCRAWTCLGSWWCCTTRSYINLAVTEAMLMRISAKQVPSLHPGTWKWSPAPTSGHWC